MENVVDYRIVNNWDAEARGGNGTHRSTDFLAERVRELITQGWRPIGGLGVYGGTIMQAMVKVQPG